MAEVKNGASVSPRNDSKRKRSPNYPVIAIDEAIDKVRAIYKEDRRAFAAFPAILEHMGYKVKEKKGGRSARVVSTLKQYGLLEVANGKYRVSDTAFKILELPEDSSERIELIRQAALTPPVVHKVLAHYKGEVPSDTTLRSHLIITEEFNPDSAGEFIRVLRRTISIVKPDAANYNVVESSEDEENPPAGSASRMSAQFEQKRESGTPPPPKPAAGQRPYPLYLSEDREAVLYAPTRMSQSEYNLLKLQINNSLSVMQATSVVPDTHANIDGSQDKPPSE